MTAKALADACGAALRRVDPFQAGAGAGLQKVSVVRVDAIEPLLLRGDEMEGVERPEEHRPVEFEKQRLDLLEQGFRGSDELPESVLYVVLELTLQRPEHRPVNGPLS